MTTLLDLNEKLTQLDELLENLEGIDIPADLAQEFEAVLSERDETQEAYLEKIDNYLGLIQSRKYWVQVRKAEYQRLKESVERDERTVQFLQDKLKAHLEGKGVKKLRTKRFNLSVCRNGGKQPIELNVESPEDLPKRFQKVRIEPDLTAIREALEAGEDLNAMSGGRSEAIAYWKEKGSHLRIK
jgi:hypothetical protein